MDRERLFERYLLGEATPEEIAEVKAFCERDPQALARLFAEAEREAELYEFFGSADAQKTREKTGSRVQQGSASGIRSARASGVRKSSSVRMNALRRRRRREGPSVWPSILAAAAVLAVVVVGWLALRARSELTTIAQRPDLPSVQQPESETAIVGRLVDVADAARERSFVTRASGLRERLMPGASLHAGDEIWTGQEPGRGGVRIELTLGARITLGDATRLQLPGANDSQVQLGTGTLTAEVDKQPAGRPFILRTQHAQATVLGTRFTLTVASGMTRLDVAEGRVEFLRTADRSQVVVAAGETADSRPMDVAIQKTVEPAFPADVMVNFGPPEVRRPEGIWLDQGLPFDAARGYGWLRGPSDGTRLRKLADPLRGSHISAGDADHVATWAVRVPNGTYRVTVCVGDSDFEQGPHHVAVEGVQLIDRAMTKAGEFIEKEVTVEVQDGELTVDFGGGGPGQISADETTDTVLDYIRIRRVGQ